LIVVAADGSAYGAGAQLLLCADLRVGGPDTRISFLGAKSGLALGTWRLPHLVGAGRAGELSLTGRPIGAAEALAAGLLDRVAEDADAEALSLATELSRAPDGVAGRVKTLLRGDDRSAERLERERLANSGHGVDRSVISR
jgi:enoyl-CoA hydratase/carnithine racemase